MNLPQGNLVRSRAVSDPGKPLETALADRLDGYLVLESQSSLLLDEEVAGVVTPADGVSILAYEERGAARVAAALSALTDPGPFRAKLYAVDGAAIERVHGRDDGRLAMTPGAPAERLADDPALAEQTRERAPDNRLDASEDHDAVASFLAGEERIGAIRKRAREEAVTHAEEWGLTDQLADDPAT